MTRKLIILIALSIGLATSAGAQGWRKLRKAAEAAQEEGELMEAAEKYEQAFSKKRRKEELAYKAAEIYYTLRAYRKAVEAYRPIKDMNDDFPLVGLKFARCLKQDGQYDRAIEEFENFQENYTGDGKDILEDIIRVEIEGCRLGQEAPARANRDIEMLRPGEGVNSEKEDFAPFPISDNELYFSSNVGDRARIYSSQRKNNRWQQSETPRNFPLVQSGHFCNGAMAPDGSRLYFTVCSNTEDRWNSIKTRCEIFVTKRVGAVWSQPERLPDYINMEDVTATHPHVVHQRGQEILYFSSNRDGGRGGMDLWYATRDLGADNNDFEFPVNLGPVVNTLGDEVTPFYNREDQSLYFASNGHASIGGFDVFKSTGDEVSWSKPENMGMPINSSSDDYYYSLNPSRTGGFMASNRVFAGQKTSTTHDDILEFAVGGRRVIVKGNVYDRQSGDPIGAITVRLYQIFEDGRESELISQDFENGSYSFEILPNRKFKVEVSAYGYEPGSYRFAANAPNTYSYGQPLFLESSAGQQGDAPAPPVAGNNSAQDENRRRDRPSQNRDFPRTSNQPDAPQEPASAPVEPSEPRYDEREENSNFAGDPNMEPVAPYVARSRNPNDVYEYQTTAPRHEGTYYKVQLAAVSNYDEGRFSGVEDLGVLQTELILSRDLYRVLLADFFSLEEARSVREQARSAGYGSAYIVEYINGERYGKVK
jgi:hypothetical protein